MELVDFLQFEPFNEMRSAMGTDQLGYFELFDPNIHLTGEERSQLDRHGLSLPSHRVGRLLDHTLCYKNTRIVLVGAGCYHLSHCDQLAAAEEVTIATSLQPLNPLASVCNACLQLLGYQGYDEQKGRKEGYNARVRADFSLQEFWREYPPYPIKRGRELVKALD